jgi:hypothetical protein
MAGYLNRAENWTLFSNAWNEELKSKPSIKYLKMAEAWNRRDEFAGWSESERNEKLRGFARVIRHFKPRSFDISVSRDRYYRLVSPISPRGLGSPHFICCFGVISMVSRFLVSEKVNIPTEFFFDEQAGVSDDLSVLFDEMKMSIPRKARSLIRGNPSFANDKMLVPLQAADMLAWHLRREHEEFGQIGNLPMANLLCSEVGHLSTSVADEVLVDWSQKMSRIPGIEQVRGKQRWRAIKKDIVRLSAAGYIPPYGSRWKNALHRVRERVARLIGS